MRLLIAVGLVAWLSGTAFAQVGAGLRESGSGWNNISGVSPGMILLCLALLFAAASFFAWLARRGQPQKFSAVQVSVDYSAVAFVVLLKNAFDYSELFEGMAQKFNFESPGERERILYKLADSIQAGDVIMIASNEIARGSDLFALNEELGRSFRDQSDVMGIRDEVFNAKYPAHTRCTSQGKPAAPDSVCLFGISFMSRTLYESPDPTVESELASFHRLAFRSPQEYHMGLYFYFSPVPGRGLTLAEGEEMFRRAVDMLS